MKRARAVILGVFLVVTLSSARADWRFAAETGAFYDSNLSNSDRAADEQDDFAWRSQLSIGNGFQLSRNLRATLGADLRGQVWNEFDAFNTIGGGFSADLHYRFGLGRQAPWLALEERLGYDRFQETIRSRWDESIGLRGGFAISERIAFEAGYGFENLAAPGGFFDQQSHSGKARLIFELTSSLQLALGYTYRDGDVISYAIPPRPDILLLTSVERELPTFGTHPLYTAYRLRGQTNSVSLSVGYALTKYLSGQVTYEYATTSHDPLQYEHHSIEAKIGFSF